MADNNVRIIIISHLILFNFNKNAVYVKSYKDKSVRP